MRGPGGVFLLLPEAVSCPWDDVYILHSLRFLAPSGSASSLTHSFNKYLRACCGRGCRGWAKGRIPADRSLLVGSGDQIASPAPHAPQAQLACTQALVLVDQCRPRR